MSKLKIKLKKNLRRTVLRGHPWIYQESIQEPAPQQRSQLCQVFDSQGEHLAWAFYDPHSPLCLRILSLDRQSPTPELYSARFFEALNLRRQLLPANTQCFRLFNGEGDLLPGLICDIYNDVAVIQFDGLGSHEFWDQQAIATWLTKHLQCKSVVEKLRRQSQGGLIRLSGEEVPSELETLENGIRFKVNLENGQKTGFFLDQRNNRKYVQSISTGRQVLNLFSYTGGFSVYAGIGGATRVASVDVAPGAIDLANQNWQLNGLEPGRHQGICDDVFSFMKSEMSSWDHIIVDPPSMGHSEEHKERAAAKYVELFSVVAKKLKLGGQLSLSSCSSHISTADFLEIITESLSRASRRARILRVSGQGPDHPFPHACHELRYLKFVHLILN